MVLWFTVGNCALEEVTGMNHALQKSYDEPKVNSKQPWQKYKYCAVVSISVFIFTKVIKFCCSEAGIRQSVAMVTEPQQVSLNRKKRFEKFHARFALTSKLVFLEILCCKNL